MIAAVVSIAGATYADPRRCHPSTPVSVLEVHGTGGRHDPVPGGGSTASRRAVPECAGHRPGLGRADGCRPEDPESSHPRRRLVAHLPAADGAGLHPLPGGHRRRALDTPRAPHIPAFTPSFRERVVAFLLAHPKRS